MEGLWVGFLGLAGLLFVVFAKKTTLVWFLLLGAAIGISELNRQLEEVVPSIPARAGIVVGSAIHAGILCRIIDKIEPN